MNRVVPFPLLALSLFGMWVLLTGFSIGHILLGMLVALVVSRVMLSLRPEKPIVRFGRPMVKLAVILLRDIIRSNIAVSKIVLTERTERHSAFVELPITLRSPYALASLAIMITATPGTLWVQHDPYRNVVLIHILDLVNEEEWIRLIKNDYEPLLMEIFE